MFGSLIFGGGYWGQGPPGIATFPALNPAVADVTILVKADDVVMQPRPDDVQLLVQADDLTVDPV